MKANGMPEDGYDVVDVIDMFGEIRRLQAQLDAANAGRAHLRPVVDAAIRWRGSYGWTPASDHGERARALVAAVDALVEQESDEQTTY